MSLIQTPLKTVSNTNNGNAATIKKIFDDNELEDLQKFLNRKSCLNKSSLYMIYLFHIIQSAGVLTTSIATSYGNTEYIWLGIGLNIVASLITVFEKTNQSISKKLDKDIQNIKDGTYVDERDMASVFIEGQGQQSTQQPIQEQTTNPIQLQPQFQDNV
jgi:hypothetical protein